MIVDGLITAIWKAVVETAWQCRTATQYSSQKIISKIENYQNKGNTRYVIAGYGTINNLDSIMAVAINEYVAANGIKSFYLHEIVIKNKDASPFMAEQQKTVSAGKASFDTTVSQKAQPVNSQYMQEGENYTGLIQTETE